MFKMDCLICGKELEFEGERTDFGPNAFALCNNCNDNCNDTLWHLDTHSTILSRKTSFHKRKGKLNYARTRHVTSVYSFKYYYRRTVNWLRALVFLPSLLPKTIRSTASRIKANKQTGELEYHC